MRAILTLCILLVVAATMCSAGPQGEIVGSDEHYWATYFTKIDEVRQKYESVSKAAGTHREYTPAEARAEATKCRKDVASLAKLVLSLEKAARTEGDRQYVTRVRRLCALADDTLKAFSDSGSDPVSVLAVHFEVARALQRSTDVLKTDLHNLTIAKSTKSGHAILNSSIYQLSGGRVVVKYPELIYLSDAVTQDNSEYAVVTRDEGMSFEPYKGNLGALNNAAGLPDGTLLETHSFGWENHPESERAELEAKGYYLFAADAGNVQGIVSISHRVGMKRSRDGGKTWEAKDIQLPVFVPHLCMYGDGIVLKDGAYIYPMWGRFDLKKEPKYVSSLAVISKDAGDTWDIRVVAKAREFDFNETSMVQAANGDVVAIMRTTAQKELWVATSRDSGKTWSEPRYSGMPGSCPYVVRTTDGLLVCICAKRETSMFADGTGMFAGVSRDNGKTWKSICLKDCGDAFVDSYPKAVAVPGGKVFTTYTAGNECCGSVLKPSGLFR